MSKTQVFLLSTGATFLVMLAFETGKEFFLNGALTAWQSHWITIGVTTALSGSVTLLAMNRVLAHRQEALTLQMREEKLKTLNQVMRLVRHHVNDLGNNLQLVDIELKNYGELKAETVDILQRAVGRTAEEMERLSAIEDPFDDKSFDITFRDTAPG